MKIQIRYYAVLRETAGIDEEIRETDAATPAAVYDEVAAAYGFPESRSHMKVVVNDEFADWQTRLSEGDTVVFIPPVAGG